VTLNSGKRAILAYHEVMPESIYSYCVTIARLAAHLLLLRAQGRAGRIHAQVTFDDGEQSQYQHAFPLLAEHGIEATFFVNPGLIGTERKFLGWRQLEELQDAGHSIQSHGWSHKFLTSCSRRELDHELRSSKESLEDRLGRVVQEISVPGGRWDRRVAEACAGAGYKRLYVSDPWISADICGVQLRGRFMVRHTTTVNEIRKVLEGNQRMVWSLRLRSEIKNLLVGIIGDAAYHKLWCRWTRYDEFEQARQNFE